MEFHIKAEPPRPYSADDRTVVSAAAERTVREVIVQCPAYAPTALHDLAGLAEAQGLGAIHYKDESTRFGLGAFKALGGVYAVGEVVAAELSSRLGRAIDQAELATGAHREAAADITVTCASAGNHGKGVAAGARHYGCGCVIFLPAAVDEARAEAIRALGATVERACGTYDETVAEAARRAASAGWTVVSDTSWEGYTEIPRIVMQGYTVMVAEALAQMGAAPPSHVFIQGGVGGVAAAVAGYLADRFGTGRPKLIVIEPAASDCLLQSARAGAPQPATGDLKTAMGPLCCREVSPLAWQILAHHADAFLAISDDQAFEAMRLLADGPHGGPPIVAGAAGAAGLAGLMATLADPALRGGLGLGPDARVLVFGTEGANEPALYARIIGRPPEEVAAH